ncbi:ABC transporter ATP-binding protein [Gemmatimonadetes bacterium T265]|nr:ABC transporter ATP-binding protein [Gemmatimonadetes bacterium T265]
MSRAIEAVGLGKQYRIGAARPGRHGTLRESLARGAARVVRAVGTRAGRPRPFIWALHDVSFSVHDGEVLGLVGRNGAGKSTLLKILSRITPPTAGYARVRGRVGSLLEVGTGFHPELSGRDNVFLNGVILGMEREYIRARFDEIVEFAGVGGLIDTPVKRYSSGMYLRLAFAVAAHLEPDILIVDEVLAVGDAEFQKKCLGKMDDVAKGGRTVLFVSHNLDAIQQLCPRTVLLDGGTVVGDGRTADMLHRYLSTVHDTHAPERWIALDGAARQGTGGVRIRAVRYSSGASAVASQPYPNGPLEFSLALDSDVARHVGSIVALISTTTGTPLVAADSAAAASTVWLREGRTYVDLRLGALHLTPGRYRVTLAVGDALSARSAALAFDHVEEAIEIEVAPPPFDGGRIGRSGLVTCEVAVSDASRRYAEAGGGAPA